MDQSSLFSVILGCLVFGTVVLGKRHGAHTKLADDGKIVGGYNTTIQNVPYQVYILILKDGQYYQCGGSIINQLFILTAAHCVVRSQRAYVRAGSTQASSGGTMYSSSDLRVHPFYNARSHDYDVALIRLNSPITLNNSSTKAVTLASSGAPINPGTEILVTGWGTTMENGETSSNLMAVKVPTVSNADCNQSYGGGITARMFCAGLKEGGKDSCQGDSGGPAVSTNDGILRGVVSFGVGCAQPGYPGVYARISNPNIRSWIQMNSGM